MDILGLRVVHVTQMVHTFPKTDASSPGVVHASGHVLQDSSKAPCELGHRGVKGSLYNALHEQFQLFLAHHQAILTLSCQAIIGCKDGIRGGIQELRFRQL